MIEPYYSDDLITIYHANAREFFSSTQEWGQRDCVIIDPPWDRPDLIEWARSTVSGFARSVLVFTDGRRAGDAIRAWGSPSWLFTWDAMNTWSRGNGSPVQRAKYCLFYGDYYERDRVLWGESPGHRDHPTTKQTALDGRRLADVYQQSLRWLHNPSAGKSSTGVERFSGKSTSPLKHSKPIDWIRCLIGNTSPDSSMVIDPFLGSGTSAIAARSLGRKFIGIDIDEKCCEYAVLRLKHGENPNPDQARIWETE